MKKLISLLLALVLCFTLAACGDKGTKDTEEDTKPKSSADEKKEADDKGADDEDEGYQISADQVKLEEIVDGKDFENVIWSKQKKDVKKALIDQAKAEGLEASFEKDGTLKIYDPSDKSTVMQTKDGAWHVIDADGNKMSTSIGKWPDDECTKLVPKPSLKVAQTATTDEGCSILFDTAVTIDDLKEYANECKAAGFDNVSQEGEASGMYSFCATNKNGDELTMAYANGQPVMVITPAK